MKQHHISAAWIKTNVDFQAANLVQNKYICYAVFYFSPNTATLPSYLHITHQMSHVTMPMTDVTTQCHVVRCCVTVTWPKTITVTAECKHWRPTSVCRGRTPGHDLLPPDGPGEPAAGAGDQLEQLDQLELEREPAGCGGVVSTQGPALLATAAAAQGWSSLAPCCRDVTRYLHTIDIYTIDIYTIDIYSQDIYYLQQTLNISVVVPTYTTHIHWHFPPHWTSILRQCQW